MVYDLRRHEYFALHLLVQGLLLSSYVVKPSRFRWLFWPAIAGVGFILFCSTLEDDPQNDMGLRSAVVSYIFVASDYIFITDVQRELYRTGQREPISIKPFLDRLKWGLKLFYGPRGVGWNYEPQSALPPHPRLTRGRFIVAQALKLAFYLLLIDVVQLATRHTLIFERDSIPTAQQPWHWRFWGAFVLAVRSAAYLNLMHVALSILCVATRISEPSGWPDLFGQWSDAYTIRKFWGRTWHQMLRRVVSSHGKYLTRKLRLPAGTNASSYMQLYTAFLISGIIHSKPHDSRPLYFFISQAVGITFEDAFIAVMAKAGYKEPHRMHKRIGYVWVFCWFTYSLPGWMDSMMSTGALEQRGQSEGLITVGLRYAGFIQ